MRWFGFWFLAFSVISGCSSGRRKSSRDATSSAPDGVSAEVTTSADGVGSDTTTDPGDAVFDGDILSTPPDVVPPLDDAFKNDVGPTCTPSCAGRECGDDGCGGSCGSCPAAAPLCQSGLCAVDCTPTCGGAECGDDGCGGSCGTCGKEELCDGGECVSSCQPACGGVQCGDDGCGGSCGSCESGTKCVGGECVGLGCEAGVSPCECLLSLCSPSSGPFAGVACSAIEKQPDCVDALVESYLADGCGTVCTAPPPFSIEIPLADVLCGLPACTEVLKTFDAIAPDLCSDCGL